MTLIHISFNEIFSYGSNFTPENILLQRDETITII